MEQFYTNEKNVLILIALLKAHGIKKIVASPGSTNVTFVGSVQQDPYFEMYSCVDERSAAYMACGMAAESGEPVVISCTGATASRNYFSALTEAYYRKLPILTITSTQDRSKVGHLVPQVIDRSSQPLDILKASFHLQTVKDEEDGWDCNIKINKAILALKHRGGGPVHLNLTTTYSKDFSVKSLPSVRKISRYNGFDQLPEMPIGKIAIYVGSHQEWNERQLKAVDAFCAAHNAVVFVDPTSNYTGKYRVIYHLVAAQKIAKTNPDLLIHIGDMSDMAGVVGTPQKVWRVAEDGDICDRYKKLTDVFEMPEVNFFEHYATTTKKGDDSFLKACLTDCERISSKIPELPLSQIWVASQLYNKFPKECIVHFGILSPLRSWSYFEMDRSIRTYCNQGGFGIDGNMSSLLGAALMNPNKIYYAVVGDLSFFYDMNVLGNRHISRNIRILLINNAVGAEFHLFKQLNSTSVNEVDKFISAGGHFGKQSPNLVKHYTQDLGFEYLSASNKEEVLEQAKFFMNPLLTERPLVFEVFTDVKDEDEALRIVWNLEEDVKTKIKGVIKGALGGKAVDIIKRIK